MRENPGMERQQRTQRARELTADLAARGVRTIALTWVDNAGVTRVKAIPLERLGHAAGWGIGMSPVFDVFVVDDSITTSRYVGGPTGDLLAALDAQEVPVEQFHPEYAPGQLEVSVAATDPVTAADRAVLVRQTIRAVSQSYGYQVSFAPVVVAGVVGNGAHLHMSPWLNGRNLLSGGGGRYGLTPPG